jgi:hypothetical protein
MSDPQRLEFVTRHFGDLQTIRFAPLPLTMILMAAAQPMPRFGRIGAWSILLSFLLTTGGFYWWSKAAIKQRYGSVHAIPGESWRMQSHPVIVALRIALGLAAVWCWLSRTSWSDIYLAFTVLLFMLTKILDSTNLVSRRIAWGLGLMILCGAVPFMVRSGRDATLFALGGGIWLALSVFDFMLIRQILGPRSAPPAAQTAE